MQLELRKLVSPTLTAALQKLMVTPGMPARAAHRLATISRLVRRETEVYEAARTAIVQAYADKDENGKVLTNLVGNNHVAQIPVDKIAEVNTKISDLLAVQVEIKEISIEDFGEVSLVPEILEPLEFIVE